MKKWMGMEDASRVVLWLRPYIVECLLRVNDLGQGFKSLFFYPIKMTSYI